jgi:hypothetical protein
MISLCPHGVACLACAQSLNRSSLCIAGALWEWSGRLAAHGCASHHHLQLNFPVAVHKRQVCASFSQNSRQRTLWLLSDNEPAQHGSGAALKHPRQVVQHTMR